MADNGLRSVRLVVQAERRLAREALVEYFATRSGFIVVGQTATTQGLSTLCALGRPQVALIDVDSFTAPEVRAIREVHTSFPAVDLVVAYTTLPLDALVEAVRAGITSFVPSSRGLDAVVRVLRHRARRSRPVRTVPPGGSALSDREMSVIALLASGHTRRDIARLLQISPHTVDNYQRSAYAKLQVDSQGLAVSRAMGLGLVPSPWIASETRPRYSTVPDLTAREHDVLGLIAGGRTIRQAARTLGIAAKTVESTQARLYRKLGTHNRAETLAVAYRLGLIEPAGTGEYPARE